VFADELAEALYFRGLNFRGLNKRGISLPDLGQWEDFHRKNFT
jgi:hypothetical protein